jgi:hypothetical protein
MARIWGRREKERMGKEKIRIQGLYLTQKKPK